MLSTLLFPIERYLLPVHFTKNVENERLHVKVESLVIEEQFGKKAEVLAVQLVVLAIHLNEASSWLLMRDFRDFVVLSVHLKDAVIPLPVDLLPRRVPHCALPLHMVDFWFLETP